jgi:hypothetical protein
MGVRSHVRSHVRLASPTKVSAPNSGFRLKTKSANSVRNDVRAWVCIHFGYPFRQNRLYNTWERLFCLCLLLLPTRPPSPLLIVLYVPKGGSENMPLGPGVSEGFPNCAKGFRGVSEGFLTGAKGFRRVSDCFLLGCQVRIIGYVAGARGFRGVSDWR